MEQDKKENWFPAKRYGWGWGPPRCWQGWVVMIVWIAAVALGGVFLENNTKGFIGYAIVLTAILLVIVVIKGDPPRWRWGGD